MLNKGIILLSISIDLLIKLLSVAEWINPLVNAFIIFIVSVGFSSRWLWQVLIPSSVILLLPNIKKHIQSLIIEIESKGKLELLLTANSYTQHALTLKDHLLWLYREEIDFLIQILRGEMTLILQIVLILCLSISFGVFNLFGTVFKMISLHILFKHSKFGLFYRNLAGDLFNFVNLEKFYRNLYRNELPDPFILEEDELKVEIVEIIKPDAKIQFKSLVTWNPYNLDEIIELKPILDLLGENQVSEWQPDDKNNYMRIWKWSKRIKYNFEESEWRIINHMYQSIMRNKSPGSS